MSDIRANMILASVFIEGVAFLAIILCVLLTVMV